MKALGLDDYFIALALVVVIALGIFNVFQISWGAGCVLCSFQKDLVTDLK